MGLNENFSFRRSSGLNQWVNRSLGSIYSIAQNFGVEKSNEFDEWQAICQSFPCNLFPDNAFPIKATINSSKSCTCQSF